MRNKNDSYAILRILINKAKYNKAFLLAKKLSKLNPSDLRYKYIAAVAYGDDEVGRTKSEIAKRHKISSIALKELMNQKKSLPADIRASVLNEYYWFSHQPYRQYRNGVKQVKLGLNRAYYSQGVGATQMAKKYLYLKSQKRADAWAKRAEIAWHHFFKVDPLWYNSHVWHALCLGFQGKFIDMERALKKASKISGKPLHYTEFKSARLEVEKLLNIQNQ